MTAVSVGDFILPSGPEAQSREWPPFLSALQHQATQLGFALKIMRSTKDAITVKYAELGCAFSGQWRTTWDYLANHRIRDLLRVKSKCIGCPFRIYCSWHSRTGVWVTILRNNTHNHGPAEATAIPILRRLNQEQQETIAMLANAGLSSSAIALQLRQSAPGVLATTQDVHNLRGKFARIERAGHTASQALLQHLKEQHHPHYVVFSPVGEVLVLLVTTRVAQGFVQLHGQVLTADCTYNTNE